MRKAIILQYPGLGVRWLMPASLRKRAYCKPSSLTNGKCKLRSATAVHVMNELITAAELHFTHIFSCIILTGGRFYQRTV